MGKKEEIVECMQELLDNQADECRWNDRLINQPDFDSFKELVLQRSEVIRKYYEKNEKIIAKLKEYAEGPMDMETAEGLFEASRRIILQGRMDPVMVTIVTRPVMEYYMANDCREKAICAIMFYATCVQDYFTRADHNWGREELCRLYQWIVDRSDDYCNYKDIRARRNTIAAYSNYILFFTMAEDAKDAPKVLELLEGLQKMWTSPEVQALDGDNPAVKSFFTVQIYYLLCEMNDFCRGLSEDLRAVVVGSMKKFCDSNRDDVNWKETIKFLEIQIANHEHSMNSAESAERWESLLDEFETPDWNQEEEKAQEIFQLASDTVLWAMMAAAGSRHMTAGEKEKYTTGILQKYQRFVSNLPYAHMGAYVNDVFKQILNRALPNVRTMRYKERIFNQLLIRRQPSTYLHTRMVEDISLLIAGEILKKEPGLFCSLPMYNSEKEVLADSENLLDIIARGARLHDAGKCNIASVIMQQSRRLTDAEFELIKSHPVMGYRFFEGTEDYDVYADIIRGHHKSYDGKLGYPEDFDNTASPYRFLIDLITISDSTDAATDILGRNYTEGKDFNRLLGELEAGAGSRYNPDIVRIIKSSEELCEKLTELTGPMRLVYSYEAYRECMKHIAI